jgi:hypothetical protein
MEILERNILNELAKTKKQTDPNRNLNTVWVKCGSPDAGAFSHAWRTLESTGMVEGN